MDVAFVSIQTVVTKLSFLLCILYCFYEYECFSIKKTTYLCPQALSRSRDSIPFALPTIKDADLVKLLAPPPNLTGELHIGHGMNLVGGDIFLKYCEMSGTNVDVAFGNDHAGHGFQKWFTKKYGTFGSESQRLKMAFRECGLLRNKHLANLYNLDINWNYSNWTLDRRSKKITKDVFMEFYNSGLLEESYWPTFARYRNNSVEIISAAEVDINTKERVVYEIIFPVKDTDEKIIATTTHPEFYHGTAALGVSSELFKSLTGKQAIMPNNGRVIPILSLNDRELGKAKLIIPAHFESDFFIAKEHNLDIINIVRMDGKLQNVPSRLVSLTLNDAKDDFLSFSRVAGKVCEQSPFDILDENARVIIIPTAHWLLNVDTMSKVAIDLLETERVKVYPECRKSILKKRLESKRQWCVSRNGWWGITLPIWYLTNGVMSKMLFANSLGEAENLAERYLKMPFSEALDIGYTIKADTRVFDTWFTSALWPIITQFSDKSSEQNASTKRLVYTCYDILESWITKMLILCPKFLDNNPPFDDIFLHGMVTDGHGKKMSKSLGNTVTLGSLINNNRKKTKNIYSDGAKSACRMKLASLTSQSDFAHSFTHACNEIEYLLTKVLQITKFIQKVSEEALISNISEIQFQLESDFLRYYLSPSFSHLGINVGSYIENFRFDRAILSLEKYVKIFSSYLIPYYRLRKKDIGFLVYSYLDMLRLMIPFASSFIYSMELPLNLKSMKDMHNWPKFESEQRSNKLDEFMKIMQLIRKKVAEGDTDISLEAPESILNTLLLEKDYVEYLLQLTYNSVPKLNFY